MRSNRPNKGSVLRKEPIRDYSAIEDIKRLLKDKWNSHFPQWKFHCSNLRACDLLNLTIDQVQYLQVGDDLVLREKKTKKIRTIVINQAVWHVLNDWIEIHPQRENGQAPLFLSRKGGKALRVPTLSGMVKSWCNAVGLTGSFGCHTLRKTFGYQHRVRSKTDLPTLQTIYGHSHQRQTLDYLCVQPDEVRDAYMKEI